MVQRAQQFKCEFTVAEQATTQNLNGSSPSVLLTKNDIFTQTYKSAIFSQELEGTGIMFIINLNTFFFSFEPTINIVMLLT